MDNETYDDIPVNAADVPDNFKFCKENELCKLCLLYTSRCV